MKGTFGALFLLLGALAWAGEPKPLSPKPASPPAAAAAPLQEEDTLITEQERAQAVAAILSEIERKYVFPKLAARHLPELKRRWTPRALAKHARARALVEALNADLTELFHDGHLSVSLRDARQRPTADASPTEFEQFLARRHYELPRVEVLPGNVGYVKLIGFAPYEFAGSRKAVGDAMGFISDTDALIIDVRQNGGGDLAAVANLVSYFVEERIHLLDGYDRVSDKTEQSWTFEKVEGPRYGKEREVYILTSSRTFSAAEEFAYDMQGLKRATLVGETTGGGANNNMFVQVSEHLDFSIPFGTVTSAFTGTNWERVGVKPEVPTAARKALRTAHELALKRLRERATSAKDKDRLALALEWIRVQPEEPAPVSPR
ncbi:MAG: S41 family peptidase [Myxococcaceae bacterium]|nr:S41 family peptidase [Myxococcaceae bacterium]